MTSAKFQRDFLMFALTLGAVLETLWVAYMSTHLPRHYDANHWDLAWTGLDVAQVASLLLTAWAAWRRRAILVWFANMSGGLLLVDAWFDVTTARYRDLGQSIAFLGVEVPSAVFLLWISWHTARRVMRSWLADTDLEFVPSRRLSIPRSPDGLNHHRST